MKQNSFGAVLIKKVGLVIVVLPALLSVGCASNTYYTRPVTADPFNTKGTAEGTFVMRFTGGWDIEGGDALKVNGVPVASPEFSLPMASSYEFLVRTKAGRRGIAGALNTIVVRTNIKYDFIQDRTYLLSLDETKGSKVGSAFLGAFIPASFKAVLYDISATPKLSKKNTVGEFPVEKLKDSEFDTAGTVQKATANNNAADTEPSNSSKREKVID